MVPVFATLLLAASAAQPASPRSVAGHRLQPGEPEPAYYVCTVQKQGPGSGGITYWLSVPVDGGPLYHRVTWVVLRQPGGLSLQAEWSGREALPEGRLPDRAWFNANFHLDHRVRGEARLEIRRRDDRQYPEEFALSGPWRRPSEIGAGSHFGTQGRWGELLAWLAGRDHLTFVLIDRRNNVLAQQRLDAAVVDAGAAAIEAARAEAERMARDYRRDCELPEPVVVTSRPR